MGCRSWIPNWEDPLNVASGGRFERVAMRICRLLFCLTSPLGHIQQLAIFRYRSELHLQTNDEDDLLKSWSYPGTRRTVANSATPETVPRHRVCLTAARPINLQYAGVRSCKVGSKWWSSPMGWLTAQSTNTRPTVKNQYLGQFGNETAFPDGLDSKTINLILKSHQSHWRSH